jgi:hypothetical protein
VNGWQNISETNTDKGVGLRLDFNPSSTVSLSYYNFFNGETSGRLRMFNGAGLKLTPNAQTTVLAQFDVGSLDAADGGDASTWYGFTLIGKRALTSQVALVTRIERFDDEDQVNIATGLNDPFRGNGFSAGLDVTPHAKFLWRTEFRGFSNDNDVFPNADGGSSLSSRSLLIVSSFSLVF